MAFSLSGEESFLVIPIVVAFLLLALIIAVITVMRKMGRKESEKVDAFLPPFVGGVIPREETYVVSRDWKPSSTRAVYAPLSIPIHVLPPKPGDFV